MGDFNKSDIEKTFAKKIIKEQMGTGNINAEDAKMAVFSIKKAINLWEYDDLEEFYEKGLTENDSLLIETEIWPMAVGYALIMRYGLGYDDYCKWAEKQKAEYAYELFHLIGIERNDLLIERERTKGKSEQEESKIDIKQEYAEVVRELQNYPRFLKISDNLTDIVILGHNFVVGEEAIKIGRILTTADLAQDFALGVFENGLKNYCTNFKEYLQNIRRVIDDSLQAFWSKMKAALKKESVSEDVIEKIKKDYYAYVASPQIEEYVHETYKMLYDELDEELQKIYQKYLNQEPMGFFGRGALVAYSAEELSSLREAVSVACAKGDMRYKVSQFEKLANETFLSSDMKDLCVDALKTDFSGFSASLASRIYQGKIARQNEFNNIYDKIKPLIFKLSDAQLTDLALSILQIFPYHPHTYHFLQDGFVHIGESLKTLACKIKVEKYLQQGDDTVLYADDERIIYPNFEIVYEGNNLCIRDYEVYGMTYDFKIPNSGSAFEKELCCLCVAAHQEQVTIANEKNTYFVSIFSKMEGREAFERDKNLDEEAFLEQINQLEGYKASEIERGEPILNNSLVIKRVIKGRFLDYEACLLTYADIDRKFFIIIGTTRDFISSKNIISDITANIMIQKSNRRYEVESTRSIRERIIEEAREKYQKRIAREALSDQIMEFRKRFKAYVYNSLFAKFIEGRYVYEFVNKDIIANLFKAGERFDSWIMYSSPTFFVTENGVYKKNQDSLDSLGRISDIREIVVAQTIYTETSPRLYVVYKNGNMLKAALDEQQVPEALVVADAISVALDAFGGQYRTYRRILNNTYTYIVCENRAKISFIDRESGPLWNTDRCYECKEGVRNHYKIVYEKGFVQRLNKFDDEMLTLEKSDLFHEENELLRIFNEGQAERIARKAKEEEEARRKEENDRLEAEKKRLENERKWEEETKKRQELAKRMEQNRILLNRKHVYCSNCGTKLAEDAVFCTECGNKVQQLPKDDSVCFCTECGKKIYVMYTFCPFCGKKRDS